MSSCDIWEVVARECQNGDGRRMIKWLFGEKGLEIQWWYCILNSDDTEGIKIKQQTVCDCDVDKSDNK